MHEIGYSKDRDLLNSHFNIHTQKKIEENSLHVSSLSQPFEFFPIVLKLTTYQVYTNWKFLVKKNPILESSSVFTNSSQHEQEHTTTTISNSNVFIIIFICAFWEGKGGGCSPCYNNNLIRLWKLFRMSNEKISSWVAPRQCRRWRVGKKIKDKEMKRTKKKRYRVI